MRSIHVILLSLALASCTQNVFTGQTVPATTEGYTLSLSGRSDKPSAQVKAYVLADPNGDPWSSPIFQPVLGWTEVGSTNTGATAHYQNDPTHPYYDWSMNSSPLSASPALTKEWRQGGLLHVKVRSTYSTNSNPEDMIAFDNDSLGCWQTVVESQGQSWLTGITDCQSPYPIGGARSHGTYSSGYDIITTVSTTPTPFQQHPDGISYLGYRGGHVPPAEPVSPDSNEAKTERYYDYIGAPLTFLGEDGFHDKYGFGLTGTDEVSAIYYNAGDLGVARDMHCKSFVASPPAIPGGKPAFGRACYVTNYGRNPADGIEAFGAQNVAPQTAINQAIAKAFAGNTTAVATVAMVYYPPVAPQPAGASVQFMAYNAKLGVNDPYGARLNFAALDNGGINANNSPSEASHSNINIPDNCLTCHGTSSAYNATTTGAATITGAYFLPFDPAGMEFSTSNSTYSMANMLPKLKALNAHVVATGPSPAIVDLLNGMYPTTTTPPGANGPTATDTVFVDTYVPSGWTSAGKGATQLYNEVVKPYCRTCHVSHNDPSRPLDWLSFSQFNLESPSIAGQTCMEGSGPMPQAEQTQNRFWESPARAHLVNALRISGSCAPCYYGVNTITGSCKTSP